MPLGGPYRGHTPPVGGTVFTRDTRPGRTEHAGRLQPQNAEAGREAMVTPDVRLCPTDWRARGYPTLSFFARSPDAPPYFSIIRIMNYVSVCFPMGGYK